MANHRFIRAVIFAPLIPALLVGGGMAAIILFKMETDFYNRIFLAVYEFFIMTNTMAFLIYPPYLIFVVPTFYFFEKRGWQNIFFYLLLGGLAGLGQSKFFSQLASIGRGDSLESFWCILGCVLGLAFWLMARPPVSGGAMPHSRSVAPRRGQ